MTVFLGEAPELMNFFISPVLTRWGSVGWWRRYVLAEWMETGNAPMDLWDVDIRRMQPFQANRYLIRALKRLLAICRSFPHRQVETARDVRQSHDRLKAAGACFGEVSGWERANCSCRERNRRGD